MLASSVGKEKKKKSGRGKRKLQKRLESNQIRALYHKRCVMVERRARWQTAAEEEAPKKAFILRAGRFSFNAYC